MLSSSSQGRKKYFIQSTVQKPFTSSEMAHLLHQALSEYQLFTSIPPTKSGYFGLVASMVIPMFSTVQIVAMTGRPLLATPRSVSFCSTKMVVTRPKNLYTVNSTRTRALKTLSNLSLQTTGLPMSRCISRISLTLPPWLNSSSLPLRLLMRTV